MTDTATADARRLADEYHLRFVDLTQTAIAPGAAQLLPEAVARQYCAVPIGRRLGTPVIALSQPGDLFTMDTLRVSLGREFVAVVARDDQIMKAIDQIYSETGEDRGPVAARARPARRRAGRAPGPSRCRVPRRWRLHRLGGRARIRDRASAGVGRSDARHPGPAAAAGHRRRPPSRRSPRAGLVPRGGRPGHRAAAGGPAGRRADGRNRRHHRRAAPRPAPRRGRPRVGRGHAGGAGGAQQTGESLARYLFNQPHRHRGRPGLGHGRRRSGSSSSTSTSFPIDRAAAVAHPRGDGPPPHGAADRLRERRRRSWRWPTRPTSSPWTTCARIMGRNFTPVVATRSQIAAPAALRPRARRRRERGGRRRRRRRLRPAGRPSSSRASRRWWRTPRSSATSTC